MACVSKIPIAQAVNGRKLHVPYHHGLFGKREGWFRFCIFFFLLAGENFQGLYSEYQIHSWIARVLDKSLEFCL